MTLVFCLFAALPVFEPGKDETKIVINYGDGEAVIHEWPLQTSDITHVMVKACLAKDTGVCVSINVTDLQPPVTVDLPRGEGGYILAFTLYDGEDVVFERQYSPGGEYLN